jgi:hypothetical protein
MKSFRVWLRPAGDFCRVRVDSRQNAQRLLDCLSQSFVFKTFDPMSEEDGSPSCSFLVPYNPPLSRSSFVKLLAAIPEVRLMSESSSQYSDEE